MLEKINNDLIIHNIFIDGSYLDNQSGIGIFDKTNGKKIFYKINNLNTSIEVEKEALKYALKYVNKENIKKFNIFTDCKYIVDKFKKKLTNINTFNDIKWIPRELNTISDELASKGRLLNVNDSNLIKDSLNDNDIFEEKEILIDCCFEIENNFLIKIENRFDKKISKKNNKQLITKININNFIKEISNFYNFNDKISLLKSLSTNDEEIIIDSLIKDVCIDDFCNSDILIENNLFLLAFTIINKNERSESFNNFIKKNKCSKQINQKQINFLLEKLK